MPVGAGISPDTQISNNESQTTKDVVINESLLNDNGTVNPNITHALTAELGGLFIRVGGGTSKEVFSNGKIVAKIDKGNEVDSPHVLKQTKAQRAFYQRNGSSEAFLNTVVPITQYILDKDLNTTGTIEPHFGISWDQYRKNGEKTPSGTKVTRESIDRFVQNYKALINETGIPHDDFIFGKMNDKKGITYLADFGNLRIGEDGELRFTDYYGRMGNLNFDREFYEPNLDQSGRPTNPEYIQHAADDPDRVKAALEKLFLAQ